jgi:tetratricopeptide (TPR) repeat protein
LFYVTQIDSPFGQLSNHDFTQSTQAGASSAEDDLPSFSCNISVLVSLKSKRVANSLRAWLSALSVPVCLFPTRYRTKAFANVYLDFGLGWKSRFFNGQGRRDFVNRRGFGQTRLFARDRLRGDLTVAVAVVAALCSCQPQSVREEKALRAQLTHELRHRSYESAIPLARRVIRIAPQDKRAWKKLVAAQIGLHDLDGAKQTLAEWRRTVRPLSSRVDELEGDIAREESDFDSARRAWEKAVAVQPKNRRVWEKIATVEQRDQQWAKQLPAGPGPCKSRITPQRASTALSAVGACGNGRKRSRICITRKNSPRMILTYGVGRDSSRM